MPTGYTYGILDGEVKTFKQFAIICMRAFGATMHLRDEPLSKQYEPQVASDYNLKAIERAEVELLKLKTISVDDLIAEEKKSLEESRENYLKQIEKKKANLTLLNRFLKEAESFAPPTNEHLQYRLFMIDQLQKTIEFDCSGDYDENALKSIESRINNLDAIEIKSKRLTELKKNIEYHTEEYNKEIERVRKVNEWVEQLLNYFDTPVNHQ